MQLRAGYELIYTLPQPTPAILLLNVHSERIADLRTPDKITISSSVSSAVPMTHYRDTFGNLCCRVVLPAGKIKISGDTIVNDAGRTDPVVRTAPQVPVEQLPEDALVFLLPSRFCESDQFLNLAWELFGAVKPGWPRVEAICNFVHNHIKFGYEHARPTRSAAEAYRERQGVCRDYAHLAISFCRALNIPARYCTGHLGDVGTPPPYGPGDFAAWFEAYLGGKWQTFDPRNNTPRIGRILIARGRDAADVAITTTFGPNTLDSFRVWCDEVVEARV